MSCPDWRSLCAHREAAADDTVKRRVADDAWNRRVADDAPEWLAALRHLDRCRSCQAAAPAFDPTLMFRRLPALEVGRDDVEAMKQAVAGMRRGQTIERRSTSARPWLRVAAVAAVLLGSLMLSGARDLPPQIAPAANVPEVGLTPKAVASEVDLWRMPLIETADPSYGSIIQVVDDDIVVLVVSSDVDV